MRLPARESGVAFPVEPEERSALGLADPKARHTGPAEEEAGQAPVDDLGDHRVERRPELVGDAEGGHQPLTVDADPPARLAAQLARPGGDRPTPDRPCVRLTKVAVAGNAMTPRFGVAQMGSYRPPDSKTGVT